VGQRHRREENNIKMDLGKIGWCGMDFTGSGYSAMSEFCEHSDKVSGFIKGGKFIDEFSEKESFCTI
jgi:hypothetical protein